MGMLLFVYARYLKSHLPKGIPLPSLNPFFVVSNSSSKHQHQCHKILANLRQDNNNNNKKKNNDDQDNNNNKKRTQSAHFGIPEGDWFCFVSSPHYLAEMLIYVSFILMTAGANVSLW